MTDDEMLARMRRVYVALDAVIDEEPMSVARGLLAAAESAGSFGFDANAGWSEEKLQNYVFMLVHNLANLCDYARRWLKNGGRDPNEVTALVRSNKAIQLLIDLSNADKHGGKKRASETYSGLRPSLKLLRRAVRLTSAPEPNSSAGMWFGADGKMNIIGTPSFVISAVVCDADGNALGDLNSLMVEAIEEWEGFLNRFGLPIPQEGR